MLLPSILTSMSAHECSLSCFRRGLLPIYQFISKGPEQTSVLDSKNVSRTGRCCTACQETAASAGLFSLLSTLLAQTRVLDFQRRLRWARTNMGAEKLELQATVSEQHDELTVLRVGPPPWRAVKRIGRRLWATSKHVHRLQRFVAEKSYVLAAPLPFLPGIPIQPEGRRPAAALPPAQVRRAGCVSLSTDPPLTALP